MNARTVLPTVGLAALLVAGLAGCSPIGPTESSSTAAAPASSAAAAPATAPASSQTKGQACTLLASSMETLSTKLSSEYTSFTNDPKAAVAAIQELSATFAANVRKVTEPGALALGQKAEADLATFVTAAQKAVAHPAAGVAAVQKQATALQKDFTQVGSYCA
ncbi:hypothetical protein GCM10025867_25810 [Frondihabitans sucicola]|uniref:Lipoprotein n=1 Tax=Frondihabitans sucicola TaxID=1268041 RepID=A0ABM8GPH1_9MICO|nr:hypothetical protein [Frondihabitans sucicola]BDZ50340.1 hypothetical protein GCM10025867_25810 [Frondihabitans sucicola]